MPPISMSGTLLLGFVLGLRHALDADHLAAVAAMIGDRGGMRRALLTGLSWGLGHALALGTAGGALIVLRLSLPERLAAFFELAVAFMLIGLGVAALAGMLRPQLHAHEHEHGGTRHLHLHLHSSPGETTHAHEHTLRSGLRPFLVGTLHGLAGTGALVLLVLTSLPDILSGCLYLLVFGIGTLGGMAIMGLVLGAPLLIARRRAAWLYTLLRAAAGIGSVALGVTMGIRIGRALLL
jgi:ABC-type nickel/cobalt efflux system permease component RcnA